VATDELRAELDMWWEHHEDLRVENAELRAEVERLKAENRGLIETISEWQEIHGTFAPNPEIERLRLALVKHHLPRHASKYPDCGTCGEMLAQG
jgi:uncharacterized coiled-coil DUF342 family protein